MTDVVTPHGGAVTWTQTQGCRVFLVENDADGRFRDREKLESSGFVEKVRCFPNGGALLKYMKATGFHDRSVVCLTPTLIIIALDNADDGFRALERLKSDSFLRDIPVLMLSPGLDDAALQRAVDLRADDVLPKPLDVWQIKRHVATAWQWPTQDMWLN